ncbi:hypothetical protein GCM10010329_35700 [Streptomyces spiroverticillatus]|uniref:Uncharacterized protein n=1 Tax=Streptomyces finlayi TaxID=67296 RepID=A0A919CAJ8_9ACTN|nr:hypothetical protein GCM10010329_35700 [Streptomyces spiroverticillatus]GHC95960.1 hypothetical protein GCM10010334_35910 [Streptomyces finlayi]
MRAPRARPWDRSLEPSRGLSRAAVTGLLRRRHRIPAAVVRDGRSRNGPPNRAMLNNHLEGCGVARMIRSVLMRSIRPLREERPKGAVRPCLRWEVPGRTLASGRFEDVPELPRPGREHVPYGATRRDTGKGQLG